MITPEEIREFRELRNLSLRDVAMYCKISPQLIGQIENRQKKLNHENYKEIINGINLAFAAKQRGELVKGKPFVKKETTETQKIKK